jgi:hypothetical protein
MKDTEIWYTNQRVKLINREGRVALCVTTVVRVTPSGVLSKLCDQLSNTHLRNNSNPARPYRCRLINFNFKTCPSV